MIVPSAPSEENGVGFVGILLHKVTYARGQVSSGGRFPVTESKGGLTAVKCHVAICTSYSFVAQLNCKGKFLTCACVISGDMLGYSECTILRVRGWHSVGDGNFGSAPAAMVPLLPV